MAVSINDVAKRAGVARSTVSYVLNEGPRSVRPELRQRVLDAMKDLDYRPSRIARSMVTRRSGTIGVIHAAIRYDQSGATFVQSILNGVARHAQLMRQDLLVFTNALLDAPDHALNDVLDGRCDGVVVIAPDQGSELIDLLAARDFPMAIVSGAPRPSTPYFVCDNQGGVYQSLDHLVELGHRRIATIHGELSFFDGKARRDAFRDYVRSHSLPSDPDWIVSGHFTSESGYEHGKRLLSSHNPPTAIVAGNDEIAKGVLAAAVELGLSVPRDLSVVGFDDTLLASLTEPKLTTVSQPLEALGAAAVRAVESLLSAQPTPNFTTFPTTLIVRASTASPKEDNP